jgi:APA family basic amino acid/polyamine antiporter
MGDSGTQRQSRRILGTGFTLAITVGGIIGLGILYTPGIIAEVTADPFVFLLLWVVGGLFALLTANVVAELVGMTPRSGGSYALVRRAYGPFPGFVMGWVDCLCYIAEIALKAVAVTAFARQLIPTLAPWSTHIAITVSTVFALLQLRSVTLSAKIQEFAATLMALIIVGFTVVLLFGTSAVPDAPSAPTAVAGIKAWSLVIVAIIYTYDGWSGAAYFSGEIEGGSKVAARACIKSVLIIIPLYLLLAGALALKVPLASIAGSEMALADALKIAVSPAASATVLVAAIIMQLAHQNLLYMSTPRVLQEMAMDGLAMKQAAEASEGRNPIFGVLVAWLPSIGLILIGGFDFLLHLTIFFYMFIYVALILGVITLRLKQPDADRPFRAWAHPWTTYLCLIVWLMIGLYDAYAEMEYTAYGVVMIAASWPVYRYLTRSEKKE